MHVQEVVNRAKSSVSCDFHVGLTSSTRARVGGEGESSEGSGQVPHAAASAALALLPLTD